MEELYCGCDGIVAGGILIFKPCHSSTLNRIYNLFIEDYQSKQFHMKALHSRVNIFLI